MRLGYGRTIIPVLMGLLLFNVVGAAEVQNQSVTTVHAVGGSRIQGADMSVSRNAAIADSLMSALTRVLMDIMPANMAVGQFQVLSRRILADPNPYILNYELLTESIGTKQHRVMVKVDLSVENLKRGLQRAGVSLSQKQYPKLLYCIAEKSAGSFAYQYWWGTRKAWTGGPATAGLQKALSDKGFGLVRPEATTARVLPLELSITDAVSLGRRAGAEVVIVGRALAQAAPNTLGSSLQSFRGTVEARAYDVRSGRELAKASGVALATADNSSTGGRQALGKAAALAAEDLAAGITPAWFAVAGGATTVEIEVQGIGGNVASFVKFRGALSTISGVDSVRRKEMHADAAVLTVDYQGSASALAEALMRQNYDTFGLNIREPEGNTIELKLVPRH